MRIPRRLGLHPPPSLGFRRFDAVSKPLRRERRRPVEVSGGIWVLGRASWRAMAEPFIPATSYPPLPQRPRLRVGLRVVKREGEVLVMSPRPESMQVIDDPDGSW